jgi:hypothetical protein
VIHYNICSRYVTCSHASKLPKRYRYRANRSTAINPPALNVSSGRDAAPVAKGKLVPEEVLVPVPAAPTPGPGPAPDPDPMPDALPLPLAVPLDTGTAIVATVIDVVTPFTTITDPVAGRERVDLPIVTAGPPGASVAVPMTNAELEFWATVEVPMVMTGVGTSEKAPVPVPAPVPNPDPTPDPVPD